MMQKKRVKLCCTPLNNSGVETMKGLHILLLSMALLALPLQQARAGDYEVANVMDDALYGAGVGGMVGLGMMLLSNSPTSHWDYLTKGIGVGIIAGAGYGVYRSSHAFAQVEDGKIHLGVPMPQVAWRDTRQGMDMLVKTDLIAGRF